MDGQKEKREAPAKTVREILRKIGMDKLLLMAVCGVVLVILSVPSKEEKSKTKVIKEDQSMMTVTDSLQTQYCEMLEKKVEELLSLVQGVGNVRVMLTLKCGSEEVALRKVDYEISKKTGEGEKNASETQEKQEESVILQKESGGTERPYIVRENMPVIEGIAVVAQGGDRPEISLKITSLLMSLFNLEAHKISVIGMK